MQHLRPPSSKNAVKKATKAYQKSSASEKQMELLDQWRASHSYVLKIFSQWLKRKIDKSNLDILFVQRLKRKNTVFDKLERRDIDDRPIIDNLTRMHDLAGCRLIFESIQDLYEFRNVVNSDQSLKNVNHKLKNSSDKYDYIKNNKPSGYRGVHDIFECNPRKHRQSDPDSPWKGLLIEIQYRTKVQHAWATSVEISDIINNKRNKFKSELDECGQQFAVISELLKRKHENTGKGNLSEITNDDLKNEFKVMEKNTDLTKTLLNLEAIKYSKGQDKIRVHNVLNLFKDTNGKIDIQHVTFLTAKLAIERTRLYENDSKSINAVYIHAANPSLLRQTFQNYFLDNNLFSKYLIDSLK
jgi:putative GTP pyrophosphokinase